MPALAADLSYGVRRTPGSRPLPDPRSPSPTQTPSTSIPRPPRSPPPARTGPRRPSLREKDVFALTASGSQQPGKYSELRGEESSSGVRFLGVPGSGLGAEPVGTAGAGMRRDRRQREVCPALSHPPQKPPAGRADALRVCGRAGAQRERGSECRGGQQQEMTQKLHQAPIQTWPLT